MYFNYLNKIVDNYLEPWIISWVTKGVVNLFVETVTIAIKMAEVDETLDGDVTKGKAVAAEDFDNELQTNTSAFEALERDFQEVLSELMGDQSLEKFRLE